MGRPVEVAPLAFGREMRQSRRVRTRRTLWICGLAALSAGFGACAGTPADKWDGGADATSDGTVGDAMARKDAAVTDDGAPPDDGASPFDAADELPSTDLGCAIDDAGCENCCFGSHADGGDTYFGALLACACSKGATCHSVASCYGSLCKGNPPSAACDNCLANPDAGDCYSMADQACAADPDCVALFDCLDNVCAPPPADASAD